MLFQDVRIESLAYEAPPHLVTSAAIEDQLAPLYERLNIPKNCLESLVGIRARRFWDEGADLSSLAAQAAEAALARAGRKDLRERLGMVVSTSVSKEYLEPSVAAMVHGDLHLPSTCENFDLANACLGFLSGMTQVARLIEARVIDSALVVAAESSRKVVESTVKRLLEPEATMQDYKDYLPTLTLGSGAVAMVLCHADIATTEHRFHGSISRSATEHSRICLGTYDWMRTNAPKLLSEGVSLAYRTWHEACGLFDWSAESVNQYICHQVGAAHLAALLNKLNLVQDKAFLSYPEHGNMGSAALPFTLGLATESGAIRPGNTLALMGIGSGLNVSMAKVTW